MNNALRLGAVFSQHLVMLSPKPQKMVQIHVYENKNALLHSAK